MSDLDAARVLHARGRSEEAMAALQAILAAQPGHVPALLLKADLLLEARESDLALEAFEQAARLAPESAEALNGLARCLHALARDVEALAVAERAKGLLNEGDNYKHVAPVYLTLVWCLREMRKYKEALAMADEGLARCPDAILAQWASVVEEEYAEAEKEEC